MAYESNDKQELLKVIKVSEFSELRISAIKESNDDLKAIDIRNWYCTQKEPEMKPTYKGVRIRKDDLADVIDELIKGVDSDVIADLVAKGYDL